MPIVVQELLADTGLRIDMNYYIQYMKGVRGYTPEPEILETDQ